MCLAIYGKSSELLLESAMEQATESKQFRWHGARVLGEESEVNVSALEVSLWSVKGGITRSIPHIDTGSIVQEAVDSWLHAISYKSYTQESIFTSLSHLFRHPRCYWSIMKANPRIARAVVTSNNALHRCLLLAHGKYVESNIKPLCQPHCTEGHTQSRFTSQHPHFPPFYVRSRAPSVEYVHATSKRTSPSIMKVHTNSLLPQSSNSLP